SDGPDSGSVMFATKAIPRRVPVMVLCKIEIFTPLCVSIPSQCGMSSIVLNDTSIFRLRYCFGRFAEFDTLTPYEFHPTELSANVCLIVFLVITPFSHDDAAIPAYRKCWTSQCSTVKSRAYIARKPLYPTPRIRIFRAQNEIYRSRSPV